MRLGMVRQTSNPPVAAKESAVHRASPRADAGASTSAQIVEHGVESECRSAIRLHGRPEGSVASGLGDKDPVQQMASPTPPPTPRLEREDDVAHSQSGGYNQHAART
jgi:hypothetical protein